MRPFEEIVDQHGAVVLRVCRALLGPVDADDAWSETFLAALRAYPDLRPDSNVQGWLVTIAHRKALDRLRATGRAAVPTDEVPEPLGADRADDPTGTEVVGELDGDLADALRQLPAKQRGAVVCRYLADLSYAEVAEVLGCSEAAARRSAADGIAALRRRRDGPAPPDRSTRATAPTRPTADRTPMKDAHR